MSSLIHQAQSCSSSEATKSKCDKHVCPSVVAVILGGGQGTRLFPLTHAHCKPAILFGGRYRLIDVPISNAFHAGIHKIFVLTQFLARSLHNHIFHTYRHDFFSPGFVEILSPEQRPNKSDWYQGTADAVRQNIQYLRETDCDYYLILSGDQLYRMDYHKMIDWAEENGSDVVVATLAVTKNDASRMGIMKVNEDRKIIDFLEKPTKAADLARMATSPLALKALGCSSMGDKTYLGSMGIYLFRREVLLDLLEQDLREDFGKHLIPRQVQTGNASAYIHEGYWEDIGTVGSFYAANMALNHMNPPFVLEDEHSPIFGTRCYLPGTKLYQCQVQNSIICEGSVVHADEVSSSILGQRAVVGKGTVIQDSYIMGQEVPYSGHYQHAYTYSIGEDCFIKKTIVDKNASIGNRVRLVNSRNVLEFDSPNVYIRDGVIVVPKGAQVPDDFVL